MAREEWLKGLTGPVNDVLKEAEDGPPPGHGGRGGGKNRKDPKVQTAIRKATTKKVEHTQEQGREKRVEELKPSLEGCLMEANLLGGEVEVYRLWLEEALSGDAFQESDTEGESIPLQRKSGGGQKMQKHGTSYKCTHVPTKITVVESGGRGGPEIKKKMALIKLREAVEELAKKWREYARDAGQAIMQAKKRKEPVPECFKGVKSPEEAEVMAALALFDETTGYQKPD